MKKQVKKSKASTQNRLSVQQQETARILRVEFGLPLDDVAKALGVTKPAIAQLAERSGWPDINGAKRDYQKAVKALYADLDPNNLDFLDSDEMGEAMEKLIRLGTKHLFRLGSQSSVETTTKIASQLYIATKAKKQEQDRDQDWQTKTLQVFLTAGEKVTRPITDAHDDGEVPAPAADEDF